MTADYPLSFRRWLRAQRRRPDFIGALAQDIARDVRDRCLTGSTYQRIRGHMRRSHHASASMLKALDQAYHEWASTTKKSPR
jgi:hypothetical protein